jgi:hypothetical protein
VRVALVGVRQQRITQRLGGGVGDQGDGAVERRGRLGRGHRTRVSEHGDGRESERVGGRGAGTDVGQSKQIARVGQGGLDEPYASRT